MQRKFILFWAPDNYIINLVEAPTPEEARTKAFWPYDKDLDNVGMLEVPLDTHRKDIMIHAYLTDIMRNTYPKVALSP